MSELKPHHIVYNSRMHDFFFLFERLKKYPVSSNMNVNLITLSYLLESNDSAQHNEGYKFNSVDLPIVRGKLIEARQASRGKKSITVSYPQLP